VATRRCSILFGAESYRRPEHQLVGALNQSGITHLLAFEVMDFVRATDVAEAVAAKADDPNAEFVAGGTDLMVEVNLADHRPSRVIGLRHVAEIQVMDHDRIGAGVTWDRLEHGEHLALAQAARTVGSPQIRAAGTIGGNIGTASPAGDALPWIAALDAGIEVASRDRGRRIVPWDQFFTGVKQTSMASDEMVTAVVLSGAGAEAQEFAKIGMRNAMVISTVSCVVARTADGFQVALGIVASEVRPITDHRSTETYRRHASGVLASRLLERCLSS